MVCSRNWVLLALHLKCHPDPDDPQKHMWDVDDASTIITLADWCVHPSIPPRPRLSHVPAWQVPHPRRAADGAIQEGRQGARARLWPRQRRRRESGEEIHRRMLILFSTEICRRPCGSMGSHKRHQRKKVRSF